MQNPRVERLRHIRWVFAAAFAITAVFHGIQAARGVGDDGSSPERHLVFAALNAFFGACFARDVRWVALPLGLLVAQQGWSHGTDLVVAARAGRVDVASAIVLVFLPLALAWSVRRWRVGGRASR